MEGHNTQVRDMKGNVGLVLSSLSLLLLVWCAFETFATVVFFWPFLKLLGYATIFFLLMSLSHRKDVGRPSSATLCVEMGLIGILFVLAQNISLAHLPNGLLDPCKLDIATTVENALRNLIVFHENPYNPSDLARWTTFPGVAFAYGPMMLVGYLPSLLGPLWFKVSSFVYLFGIWMLTVRLAVREDDALLPKVATGLFASAVLLMPRAILNDVSMGINDHFPMVLVLGSLSLLLAKKEMWAGVLAGLSLSAKFSPAAFLIVLLVRRKFPVAFFFGVALGCLPMLPFFIWNPERFFHDIVYFHFVKVGSPTSAFTIVPPELHYVIRALRWVCVAVFVARNFTKEINVTSLMYEFTLLVIIINALHIEIHSNYLVWVLPTAAVLFARYRYRAWSLGRSVLGCSAS